MKAEKYLPIIDKIKQDLKSDPVIIEICKKFHFEPEQIDLIPVQLGDIDVSAKTDQCVITLHNKFINDIKTLTHLLCHEISHYCSQVNHATQSADDGDYLENKEEQQAFQFQLKFIDENDGLEEAKDYVDQVLDHHDEHGIDRKKKKDILMKKVEMFNDLTLRKL